MIRDLDLREEVKEQRNHIFIGIALAVGIIVIINTIGLRLKEPEATSIYFEITYVILAEIILFLLIIFSRVIKTADLVIDHNSYVKDFLEREKRLLLNIDKAIKNIVHYEKEEEQILEFLEQTKSSTKDRFYVMWCPDYEKPLEEYFKKEKQLLKNVEVTRLINLGVGKEKVKEHLMSNKEDIINGNYIVYSTYHRDFEILICFRARDNQDTIAIQIFRDLIDNRVDLAIYSHEKSFANAMIKTFEALKGERLEIKDPNKFDDIVNNWLGSTA